MSDELTRALREAREDDPASLRRLAQVLARAGHGWLPEGAVALRVTLEEVPDSGEGWSRARVTVETWRGGAGGAEHDSHTLDHAHRVQRMGSAQLNAEGVTLECLEVALSDGIIGRAGEWGERWRQRIEARQQQQAMAVRGALDAAEAAGANAAGDVAGFLEAGLRSLETHELEPAEVLTAPAPARDAADRLQRAVAEAQRRRGDPLYLPADTPFDGGLEGLAPRWPPERLTDAAVERSFAGHIQRWQGLRCGGCGTVHGSLAYTDPAALPEGAPVVVACPSCRLEAAGRTPDRAMLALAGEAT